MCRKKYMRAGFVNISAGWYVAVFPFEPQFEDGVNHLENIARLLDEVSFYKSLFVFGDGAWRAKPVFCYYRLGIEMSLSHADGTQKCYLGGWHAVYIGDEHIGIGVQELGEL